MYVTLGSLTERNAFEIAVWRLISLAERDPSRHLRTRPPTREETLPGPIGIPDKIDYLASLAIAFFFFFSARGVI